MNKAYNIPIEHMIEVLQAMQECGLEYTDVEITTEQDITFKYPSNPPDEVPPLTIEDLLQ